MRKRSTAVTHRRRRTDRTIERQAAIQHARELSPWLDELEAAAYLKRAPGTLANLRWSGKGPEFFQPEPGGKVLYERAKLDAWVRGGARSSTTNPPEAMPLAERRAG